VLAQGYLILTHGTGIYILPSFKKNVKCI